MQNANRLQDDRDAFLRSVFEPRDHTQPDYRGLDPETPWRDALAVVGDPKAEPARECAAARKANGAASERTQADFDAICERMAQRAREKWPDGVPDEEPAAEPLTNAEWGRAVPIIEPRKPKTPLTRPVRFMGRTFTPEAMYQAEADFCRREQARFLDRAANWKPPAKPKRKPKRKAKADARAEAVAEAKAMHGDGVPVTQIMEHLGVSRATVFRWLKAA